jgi:hypothetical protein
LNLLADGEKFIKRRKGKLSSGFGNVEIHHGGINVCMAQQFLNGDDVKSEFQEMGSIGVPQGMNGDLFLDPCFLDGFPNDPLRTALREGLVVILSIEQPLDGMFSIEVFFYSTRKMFTQRNIPVLSPFTLPDVDHAAIEVDVLDEQ